MKSEKECEKVVSRIIQYNLFSGVHPKDVDLYSHTFVLIRKSDYDALLTPVELWMGLKALEQKGKILHVQKHEILSTVPDDWRLRSVDTAELPMFECAVVDVNELQSINDTKELQKEEGAVSEEIYFDEDTGILNFFGTPVRMRRRTVPTDAQYLLMQLMKDPSEPIDYSDSHVMCDVFGDDSYGWKKYYAAASDIQARIAKETTVKDFLIIGSGGRANVSISPKYIDKIRVS